MTTIRWSPQAADDLESIQGFIARDSAHYAKLVVQRIVAAIDMLATSPQKWVASFRSYAIPRCAR